MKPKIGVLPTFSGLGRSWTTLGRSWAPLGHVLDALGALLRTLGVLLGHLGSSWPCAGASWGDLGVILGLLGSSWPCAEASWGDLGAVLGRLGSLFLVKLAPRWGQDGAKMAQDRAWVAGHLEANWGAILGTFGGLGDDLCKKCKSVKTTSPPSL